MTESGERCSDGRIEAAFRVGRRPADRRGGEGARPGGGRVAAALGGQRTANVRLGPTRPSAGSGRRLAIHSRRSSRHRGLELVAAIADHDCRRRSSRPEAPDIACGGDADAKRDVRPIGAGRRFRPGAADDRFDGLLTNDLPHCPSHSRVRHTRSMPARSTPCGLQPALAHEPDDVDMPSFWKGSP